MIKFKGYNIMLQFMKTDKSFRVIIETGLDEYDNIKDLPKLAEGIYSVIIEPELLTK